MAAIARLQSSSCLNPVLDVFTTASGTLVDVEDAQYQIFDKTTGVGVQVFPPVNGDRAVVDLDDCADGGDRLGVGRYVAQWSVPSNANLGTYYIRWFLKLTPSSPEQTYTEEFEVLAEVVGSGDPNSNYAMVADLRAEGYSNTTAYPDALLQRKIAFASRLIENATKRFFYPKPMTVRLDGRGGPMLLLSDPIISIEYVKALTLDIVQSSLPYFEADEYRVYNRHITQNLVEPDDRDNPKIELVRETWFRNYAPVGLTSRFARGSQNVEIKGWFGYTEYDGTSKGRTPELIKYATMLIVRKYLLPIASGGGPSPSSIVSESTRDQSITYAAPRIGGLITQDPEIDSLLANFYRPPGLGAV